MPSKVSKAVKAMKDLLRAIPCQARYWDGKKRYSRYDLRRVFREWRANSELRMEADQSFEAYDGGDFVDVGASVGLYAALLAPKARPGDRFVLCEPDCRAYPRLFANLAYVAKAFPQLAISVVPVPIGDGGSCSAIALGGDPAGHYQFGVGKSNTEDHIKTTAIDDLVAALGLRPSFIKIDVEGAEYNVLCGMENTLREHRPKIAIEVHPTWLPAGVTAESIDRLLASACLSRRNGSRNTEHPRDIWTPAATC